jgi:HK97 family phage portal protein
MFRAVQYVKNLFSRSDSARYPNSWFNQLLSKIPINTEIALKVAAVYACNKVLSETISTLPLKCYERTTDGGKEEYNQYFLSKVFKKPNVLQTQAEYFENLVTQINLKGNSYSAINYKKGYVNELLPMNPILMYPEIKDNNLIYTYHHQDRPLQIYKPDRIFHVKNLTLDGLTGLSPISYAAKAVNLAAESEDHGYRYFKNGTRASGFLKHPGQLKGTAYKNLETSFNKKMSGEEKFKIQILEEGMEWVNASMTNEDSQYLQTRQFQVEDIARWYRVPLELIQHPAKTASYASVEQFMLSFVVHTIRPWCVKIEQRINTTLIPEEDQDRIFFEFKVDGLLRGDLRSRYAAYSIARQWGWLSADDVRALENMNPLPEGAGKKYLTPLNMINAKDPQAQKEKGDPDVE